MNKIVCFYCILSLLSCQNKPKKNESDQKGKASYEQYKEQSPYTISGEGWDDFEAEIIRLQVSDTVPESFTTLAEDTIHNGGFKLKGKIKFPQNSFVAVYDIENEYIYSKEMVVEPGTVHLKWDSIIYQPKIQGGIYNQKIIKKIYESKKIIDARLAYEVAENENYFIQDTIKYAANQKTIEDYFMLLSGIFDSIRYNDDDAMASLLAMSKSNLFSDYETESLNAILKEVDSLQNLIGMGEIPESTMIKDAVQTRLNVQNAAENIAIGKQIKDFTAKDLKGKEFNLQEQLNNNTYVLVEFWASWCGPCRAEIPNLKAAYQDYNDDGFGIVSFSIDSKEEKWKKASEEENIPWVNVSDLMAMRSPVAKLYGITAIPANYLVDANGTIVATDLRGAELDEKIKELLML